MPVTLTDIPSYAAWALFLVFLSVGLAHLLRVRSEKRSAAGKPLKESARGTSSGLTNDETNLESPSDILRTRFNEQRLLSPSSQISYEFADLVNIFLRTEEQYSVDWMSGAHPGSPIQWFSEGLRDDPPEELRTIFGCCARNGALVVSVAGKPAFEKLCKTVEPGLWAILLVGPYAGVNLVKISAMFDSSEYMPLDVASLLQAEGCHLTVVRGTEIFETTNNAILYRITTPKRKAWIANCWSMGNHTGVQEVSLVFDEKKAAHLWDIACKEYADLFDEISLRPKRNES